MYENIHREEAKSTDYDADVQELAGVAPPCKECGRREAVEDGYCGECAPGSDSSDNTDKDTPPSGKQQNS